MSRSNTSPRWHLRPEGSTWGDFGPNDQLGRLNLLTPEKVRQGVAEVREGRTFCLSLPLDYPGGSVLNPRRHPPVLRPTRRSNGPNFNYVLARDDPNMTDVVNDDLVVMHLQYSTQWDSLAHVGSLFDADGDGVPEPCFYNGFRAGVDIVGPSDIEDSGPTAEPRSTSQANALGVERMAEACCQGRGVMIDLPALAQAGCCAALPLHEHCLFKLGVNLGELWYLTPLAKWLRENKRYRFLLTAPPLRLPGAVGSPATPIATV